MNIALILTRCEPTFVGVHVKRPDFSSIETPSMFSNKDQITVPPSAGTLATASYTYNLFMHAISLGFEMISKFFFSVPTMILNVFAACDLGASSIQDVTIISYVPGTGFAHSILPLSEIVIPAGAFSSLYAKRPL